MKFLSKAKTVKGIKKIIGLSLLLSIICIPPIPVFADNTGQKPSDVSVSIDAEGLKMVIGENWFQDYKGVSPYERAEEKAKYTPNTVVTIRTIPADDIRQIDIYGQSIGIVLEPSDTGAFELDLVGIHDPTEIKTDISVKDGVLLLKAEGKSSIDYINASEDKQINIVRLRVPSQTYSGIHVEGKTAIVRMKDFGPPISGAVDLGVLTVKDTVIKSDCTLTTKNGNIMIQGDEITGAMKLKASNGSVGVKGKTVLGELMLETANGSVEVTAETLGKAELVTQNGRVSMTAGLLTGDVTAGTKNGSVVVKLNKEPENLTLAFSTSVNGRHILPAGWTDDKILGNGSPKLAMSCINGSAELRIGRAAN